MVLRSSPSQWDREISKSNWHRGWVESPTHIKRIPGEDNGGSSREYLRR